MKLSKLNIFFLIAGLLLLFVFLYKLGIDALKLISSNINLYYFGLFIMVIFLGFIPYVLRFQAILNSYFKGVPFITLYKQLLVYFAVSYITPASRVGGEPVRIYMLKKECNIDYKTGSTVVILDKLIEILGSSLFGVLGLIILLTLPINFYIKLIFGLILLFSLSLLTTIFFLSFKNKPTFSKIFIFLKLDKIKKWDRFTLILKDVELKMHDFFKYHKKNFLLAFMFYIMGGIFFLIEWKLLLLSIGFNASITQLILLICMWGITNFIPTPASLGFFEAGQSSLFYVLRGNTTEGLATALMLRFGYSVVVILGFLILINFSRKNLKYKNIKTIKT